MRESIVKKKKKFSTKRKTKVQNKKYFFEQEEEKTRRETICMWERVGRKGGIGKVKSMETWKNKMEKYQENSNFGKYESGKYLENWKYRKYEEYELGKYEEKWKYVWKFGK